MKEEKMFDGITNIKEDLIEWAGNYEFRKEVGKRTGKMKPMRITLVTVAACLLLVFMSPFLYMATRRVGSEPPKGAQPGDIPPGQIKPGDKMPVPAVTIAMNDVWIYYVDGEEIRREQQYLTLQAEDVFASWKEKNNIGEEVQLLDFEIRSNATTEQKGEMVMHVLGDYRCLYLVVSKNLEAYYEKLDSALLLESLKQTMTGYSRLEYQEYHLTLE